MQLSHLVSITPTSLHAEDYAEIVSRTATMRKLIAAASKIAELGYSDNDDLEITLRQTEDYASIAVPHHPACGSFQSFRRHLQDRRPAGSSASDGLDLLTVASAPLMTGFYCLSDELLGGIQQLRPDNPRRRPSVGKSTLALNIAMHNAKADQTCAFFSLEMTADQLSMRALASETGIDSHRIRLGLYSSAQEDLIVNAIGELSELPIYIDDTPYQGMVEIRGKARRLDLNKGVDLIMVDYLQLVQGRHRGGPANRVMHQRVVEQAFEIPVEHAVISGTIDLLLREDTDGNILEATVIDFKTMEGGPEPEENERLQWTDLALQVQLYAKAANEVLGENARTGAVHLLRDNQRVEVPVCTRRAFTSAP